MLSEDSLKANPLFSFEPALPSSTQCFTKEFAERFQQKKTSETHLKKSESPQKVPEIFPQNKHKIHKSLEKTRKKPLIF